MGVCGVQRDEGSQRPEEEEDIVYCSLTDVHLSMFSATEGCEIVS